MSLCGWAKSEARWAPPGAGLLVWWPCSTGSYWALHGEAPLASQELYGGWWEPSPHTPPTCAAYTFTIPCSNPARCKHWDPAFLVGYCKREGRSCGDSGIPFSQARCSGGISKLLSLDRNLLCHCGSRRVVPEPGKCFHLDLRDEPGLTQICSRDQAFLIPCQK